MLVVMFIDTLVCKNCSVLLWDKKRYNCLAGNCIKVYRKGIKVSKTV